jgi:hypothetical protein
MNYPFRIITVGEQDSAIVEKAQIVLNKYNSGSIVVDGIFGKETFHAVKKYQSTHCDRQGHPLAIDGIIGLQTWSSLYEEEFIPAETSNALYGEVIRIASGEIGVCEDPPGSNKGTRIDEYLRAVDMPPGFAWCCAFVFWCFMKACSKLRIPNPLPRTAGCMQLWKKSGGVRITRKEALEDPSLIVPGLIFIISRGDGKGHTGIVTGVENGLIHTIEGNTNNTHAAEGLMVCALSRKISTISAGFIRYD